MLSKDEANNQLEHPVLFQSPRMDPLVLGGDLETLYLEEIDVSDSHDINSVIRYDAQHDSSTPANRREKYSLNEIASPRQILFPRPPRIFSPQILSLTADSNLANFAVVTPKQSTGKSVFHMTAMWMIYFSSLIEMPLWPVFTF